MQCTKHNLIAWNSSLRLQGNYIGRIKRDLRLNNLAVPHEKPVLLMISRMVLSRNNREHDHMNGVLPANLNNMSPDNSAAPVTLKTSIYIPHFMFLAAWWAASSIILTYWNRAQCDSVEQWALAAGIKDFAKPSSIHLFKTKHIKTVC